MFQIRIHGRGGQGVVTAAELLSVAAFVEGRHAQAFPSFGSERMGAPVVAFCRIDDQPIRVREPIAAPDALIVQDPTLLHQVDLFSGLRRGRLHADQHRRAASTSSGSASSSTRLPRASGCCTVPATELAREHLGRPLPNAVLLGGFAALTGRRSRSTRSPRAIRERFPGTVGERNVAGRASRVRLVRDERRELADA